MSAADKAAQILGVRVAAWLAAENDTGQPQLVLQALAKPIEELAEVRLALRADNYAAAAAECADLVITCRAAQAALGRWPGEFLSPVTGPVTRAGRDVRDGCDDLTDAVLEIGELVISWTRQNPRKRHVGVTAGEVADQLRWVVARACQLIHALGFDVDEILAAGVEKVHGRLDEMGVPR